MKVILGINCPDYECVKKRFEKAVALDARTVQIDVADGKFAPVRIWDRSEELKGILEQHPEITAEVHLMVEEPGKVFEKWLAAGAKKLVVHVESAGDLPRIRDKAKALGAEIVWGIKTGTPIDGLNECLKDDPRASVQVLAVSPGPSGQVFNPENLKKVISLRSRWPDISIRVDGGMNPETAKTVKEAGADAIISTSYIFESNDAAAAYQELLGI